MSTNTDAVLRSTQGRIGILTINNPPVNALAAAVRSGIKEGVEAFGADPNIDAIVLIGGGRTFIAGADIREFGKPPSGANLNEVIATMENCPKIVVAALHGTPLGGGLETALAAHYRVALPSTRVGLPEVHLGLLPGAGGTQRLPRLAGAKYALDAILSGRHIPAPEAKSKGIKKAFITFHYPVFARSGLGPIPAETNPHKVIASYVNDMELVVFNGHVHTTEMYDVDGVKYLMLGGGGAEQDPILPGRTSIKTLPADYPPDLYWKGQPPQEEYNYVLVDVKPGEKTKFTLNRFRPGSAEPFASVKLFK